eukprot:457600-Rhodomonas_salina.3
MLSMSEGQRRRAARCAHTIVRVRHILCVRRRACKRAKSKEPEGEKSLGLRKVAEKREYRVLLWSSPGHCRPLWAAWQCTLPKVKSFLSALPQPATTPAAGTREPSPNRKDQPSPSKGTLQPFSSPWSWTAERQERPLLERYRILSWHRAVR